MKAVVLDRSGVSCRDVPPPAPRAGEVVIDVAYAGVCRTDLFVADGLIRCELPRILGHELSGKVVGTGERVSVDPRLVSGFLGIDRDGAFAEQLCVPVSSLVRLPPDLPLDVGAYIEPVAAALAVTKSGIRREQRGLVWGNGRIAELLLVVLAALGFRDVQRFDHGSLAALESERFDFAIETGLDDRAFEHVVRALIPGGRLVLKSRTQTPVGFPLLPLVKKEIEIRAVAYGSFDEAVELVHSGRIDVRALLGPKRPLSEVEQVFAEARRGESNKLLFAVGGG
jgi:L-iditol 2-dehydrogenase